MDQKMADDLPPPKRLKLSDQQWESLSKEQLLQRCKEQEAILEKLDNKHDGSVVNDVAHLRESEEKQKQQVAEACRRENVAVMRLTTKEQEMQEYLNQIQELKQAQSNSTAQLRSMLLDPAVNIMFQRMKKELEDTKQKLEQTQNDLSAWKFTPDSQTGKRLMARCRMLLQENDELGKVTSSGRMAKLEGDIALEKTLVQEMKKGQAEMDEFLAELDEDVEGMQSTIYILQTQLKEARDEVSKLQKENDELRKAHASAGAFLPFNTDSKSVDMSQGSTRTSTPTSCNLNLHVETRTEQDDNEVQNYYYHTTRANFPQATSNGKMTPKGHDWEEKNTTGQQMETESDHISSSISTYHTSKNSNFYVTRNDHKSNVDKNEIHDTETPTCNESTGTPSGDEWSPKPVINSVGDIDEGEESDQNMDTEGDKSLDNRTGSVERDPVVPNGLETSPSYSSQEETS